MIRAKVTRLGRFGAERRTWVVSARASVLLCVVLAAAHDLVAAEAAPDPAVKRVQAVTGDAEKALGDARRLYLRGNYAEAAESYELLAKRDPVGSALGLAACALAVGNHAEADKHLAAAADKRPDDARLLSERARLAYDRGNLAAAQRWVDAALKVAPDEPKARWIAAELLRSSGKVDEADKAYQWFIEYYNQKEPFSDPEILRIIGLAAAQNARWQRIHDQFGFLVNELHPDALKLDADYWPAHLEAGLLFLEKFNQPEAAAAFKAALQINPNAAEVHAALARLALQNYELDQAKTLVERALKVNPNLLEARILQADIELANFDPAAAEKILADAVKLRPVDERTLGRLAAARGALDGLQNTQADSRLGRIIAEVEGRNPRAGDFHQSLGESLDSLRRWPESARYFARAVEVMPQLTSAYGQLGLIQMRLGHEAAARKSLEKAFDVDFGNVRVKNSLEVLDVLDTYAKYETEHFIIRYDPKQDALQARALAEYLEEIYPELTRQLGYQPQEKTLFEIFNKAKNTTGHGWFSARTVGLPHIHTIGACVGRMVAMVSPAAMKKKFNWARVVKHEFVHVINLQQTNFRIPHWFTEALAVYNEGYPRPDEWNEMLARRVPEGKVFKLATINQGFIRPESSEDWQMAYCQAEMYAEYMVRRFGNGALAKMLAAYDDNLDTSAAIRRAFGVDVEDFERGYSAYVQQVVGDLNLPPARNAASLPELLKAVEDDAKNPDKLAALASVWLEREAYAKAGTLARQAVAANPAHPEANYVLARLDLLVGKTDGVADRLAAALDRKRPHAALLKLLAGLKYKQGDYAAAADFYRLGQEHFRGDFAWTRLLARVYLKSNDNKQLKPVLAAIAEHEADELAVRKKLAELSFEEKEYEAAARWARETLHITVADVDARRILAAALVALKQFPEGIREYETAIELSPKQPELRIGLAEACLAAGDKPKARLVIAEMRRLWPDHAAAAALEKKLQP